MNTGFSMNVDNINILEAILYRLIILFCSAQIFIRSIDGPRHFRRASYSYLRLLITHYLFKSTDRMIINSVNFSLLLICMFTLILCTCLIKRISKGP